MDGILQTFFIHKLQKEHNILQRYIIEYHTYHSFFLQFAISFITNKTITKRRNINDHLTKRKRKIKIVVVVFISNHIEINNLFLSFLIL